RYEASSPLPSCLLDRDLAESGLEAFGNPSRVIETPEVHEEQARRLAQHVRVQGGDLDPVRGQLAYDGVDLVGDEDEVPCRGHSRPHDLEVQGGGHPEVG